MNKFCDFFKKSIAPMIYNRECEKKMRAKEKKLSGYNSDNLNDYNFEYVPFNKDLKLENIKEEYDSSITRMKQFEEKAKTNLVAISISVTITFGLIKPITDTYDKYDNLYIKFFLFIISILIVMFMLYGGIISLKVLMDKNIVYKVGLKELSEDKKGLINVYGMYAELNEINNTIRNNYINTSYRCMKNALILLSLIFFIGIIPIKFNTGEQSDFQKNITPINNSIRELKDKNIKDDTLIEEQKNRLNDLEKSNDSLQLKLKELEEKLDTIIKK